MLLEMEHEEKSQKSDERHRETVMTNRAASPTVGLEEFVSNLNTTFSSEVESVMSTVASSIADSISSEPGAEQVGVPFDSSKGGLHHKRVVQILLDQKEAGLPNRKSLAGSEKVPIFGDEYFIIDDSENTELAAKGDPTSYDDCCGAWIDHRTKMDYLATVSGKQIVVSIGGDGKIYKGQTKKEVMPDGALIHLKRYYRTSKSDPEFKKKVTKWVNATDNVLKNLALVEYIGKCPKKILPHGNAKRPTAPSYCRIPRETRRAIKEKISKPSANTYGVYTELMAEGHEPRNLKAIQHQKELLGGTTGIHRNIALQYMEINLLMAKPGTIIRELVRNDNKNPSLILYKDQTIKDFKSCCCQGCPNPSIVGLDRTFNLGDFFATTMVFQHPYLYSRNTATHPAILAAVFLHEGADEFHYSRLLSHIKARLDHTSISAFRTSGSLCVFGSDEEKALVNACQNVFTSADNVFCRKHMKDTLARKCIKEGMAERNRNKLSIQIFGRESDKPTDAGILASKDEEEFAHRQAEIVEQDFIVDNAALLLYLETKFFVRVREHVWMPMQRHDFLQQEFFFNNAVETLNKTLKSLTNWKPQGLPSMVKILEQLLTSQDNDIQKALRGFGRFSLIPALQHLQISENHWQQLSEDQRNRRMERFYKGPTRKKSKERKVVMTPDGSGAAYEPRRAKKPGQSKTPRGSRTLSKPRPK